MSSLRMAQAIFDILYPVGTYYETSNVNFNPNNDPNWYGTWVQDTKGQTLVSKSDSGTFSTLGSNVGEEKHTLTTGEIPNHEIYVKIKNFSGAGRVYPEGNGSSKTGTGLWALTDIQNNYPLIASYTDGGQSHNNIQPSKVCIRWHRTA